MFESNACEKRYEETAPPHPHRHFSARVPADSGSCSIGMSDENQLALSVGSFVSLRLELRSFVIVQGQIAQSLELDCLAEAEFFHGFPSGTANIRNPLFKKNTNDKKDSQILSYQKMVVTVF